MSAALLVALPLARGGDIQWSNGAGNNDWNTPGNWAGGALPLSTDNPKINLAGANRAVFSAGTSSYNLIRVGDSGMAGELLVTGGSLSSSSTTVTYIGVGGRTGTVTVTNGSISFGGYMEVGLNSGSVGTLNVSGGLLDSARNGTMGGVPSVSIGFGDGASAQGTCILSGGELRTRTGILLGANGGTGRFEVRGAGMANIGTDNAADDGFWVQSSNSVLAAYVTNGTLGSIYVAHLSGSPGTYSSGNAMFMPGSKLELGFLDTPSPGAWDLMKWDGQLLTNGLSLASGTDTNWSFQLVTNNGGTGPDTLRIIYIAASPVPPTGLVAVPGNAQVTLRWSAESGATNYFLKRATSPGGPYTVTNSVSGTPNSALPTLNFTDTGLTNGVTYYYVVSAALTNGLTGNSSEVRAAPFTSTFVHPGVMHRVGDLDRMYTNVLAGNQPWLMGYTNLLADSHSSSAYPMAGPQTTIVRDAPTGVRPYAWEDDCGGAYQNALLWYLTGDPAHAAKAIQILDAWAGTSTNFTGSDARLTAGLQGFKFITAAELIRYTGAPWSPAEINTCSNFIRNVILPVNRLYGGGNWGQCGAASALAAGVFLEDEAVFNEALNALKYGAPTECDMGIVNYINSGGWTTEADRDIGHWGLALDDMTEAAWTAWCQGADLWTYLNNRLLTAHEYLGQYILTTNVASYVAGSQCDGPANGGLTTTGLGVTWNPFWEQAFHPYQNLVGLPAPWCSNMVNQVRPEGYDRDHIAFGTVVAALPPRNPGLPILPSGLMASWSNAQVKLTWNAASGAASYNLKRAPARGGPFTNLATGIVATNYTDNTALNGVRYFYTASAVNGAGETANSGLASAYPSASAPAAPTGLTASASSHVRTDLAWNAAWGATSYVLKRSTTPGGTYTVIAIGAGTTFLTYADSGLTPNTTYYYVLAAANNLGTGSLSTEVSATTLPPLPSPWNYADAGYLTTPGNATYTNGTFTVHGAGLDYGGLYSSDAFGFAYLPLNGDAEIIARYANRSDYSALNKTGLTMRESLAGGSRHVFVYVGGDGTASLVYRTSTGANGTGSGSTNLSGTSLPQWLKLKRAGNTFTGSVSADGTNWTAINSVSFTMNTNLLVGLAVCSRNNGVFDTGVFDNLSLNGQAPVPPPTPAGLSATAGDARATLSWLMATNATGYNLKRASASNGPYALVAANVSSLSFTNTGLSNGTLYHFAVSATNSFGESADSPGISVRPVSLSPPWLGATVSLGQLQLAWPLDHTGWRLEAQTNAPGLGLGTNWFTVVGSTATNQFLLPLSPASGSAFFRLMYP